MRFLRWRTLWFTISALLIGASIFSIATWGLRVGIDFSGGQLLEVQFTEPTSVEEMRDALGAAANEHELPSTNVTETGTSSFLIRISASPEQLDTLRNELTEIGEWQELRFENVGPTVGRDLTKRAIIGIILASIAIGLYIAWAFRRVPPPTNSWQFGLTAIVALVHDLIITIGAFAALGQFLGYEVDSLFITALLTVMGFSVHDTIVTYDRIRENLLAREQLGEQAGERVSFATTVYASIDQTIVRSLNTSLTLLLVLLSLLILGGSSIRPFISALLIGVTIGTYSSIFIAAPLLVVWQARNDKPPAGKNNTQTTQHTSE